MTLERNDLSADDARTRAFNNGCDARFSGYPPTANPCPSAQLSEQRAWVAGWYDVHYAWGLWARKRGIAVRPLAAIGTPARALKRKAVES